ncbi:MAG: peptide ABC transporter substrate-binding protein [Candidatus Tectimicrobiota bacterium]|nr:MAG: peptide ABC transporter substrate-binding protein [Candidatus Tectomicrobia bacterium]
MNTAEIRTQTPLWTRRQLLQTAVGGSVAVATLYPVLASTQESPKYGGILNATHRGDPPSLSIHEEATISTVWPAMPCYNNLVLFDPLKPQESADTIIGELAESWEWQDEGRSLVFHLRRGVKWHDGKPFTSRDVQYTFDLVREAPGMTARLRVNPRKLWYENVERIDTPDAWTAIFRLQRPQPSLLVLLASGYSPIYPAHVPPSVLRTRCVGTGPFRFKEYRRGEVLELERNPDYFIEGRPYLDGIRYLMIKDRATRTAALQARQVDIAFPGETTKTIAETLRRSNPELVIIETSQNVNDNILINFTRSPFDNPELRLAINLAIDRKAYVQAVHQGGALPGAAMLPRPYGVWGLPEEEVAKLPGYGDPRAQKEEARQILGKLGYGPRNPLRVTMSTRAIAIYVDFASFVIDQLKQVGIEATLEQVETGVWHPKVTRKEYELAANLTGIGPDDPDANFFENYKCGSPRNYPGYCNPEVDAFILEQSQLSDVSKRRQLVHAIDKRLQEESARPIMGWRIDYFTMWPQVKNLVPHQSIYNYGRMQEVWLAT